MKKLKNLKKEGQDIAAPPLFFQSFNTAFDITEPMRRTIIGSHHRNEKPLLLQ